MRDPAKPCFLNAGRVIGSIHCERVFGNIERRRKPLSFAIYFTIIKNM
jgi:hypothetical protein